jgi:CHAD domain-containing protein
MLLKTTPLWIASKGLLAERGADFFRCLKTVSITYDPEDIHDLRVASRRLREGLTLFARSFPAERISRLRKDIRKVTDILGALRNLDECLAFFRAEAVELGPEHGGELAGCIELYAEKRGAARKRLKRDLRAMKPATLMKNFKRTVQAPYLFDPPPEACDPFMPIAAFARESIDERLAAVLDLVLQARIPEESAAQHRLRIAVKRYRYRMEVLSPFMGEGYRDELSHVKGYQEILGRIHDLDVFAELIRAIGLPVATEEAFVELLAAKRDKSFTAFCAKLDTVPFEEIGARVRGLL